MKKLCVLLTAFGFLTAVPMLSAAPASTDYTMPSQDQLQAYYAKLDEQVKKAQDHLDGILQEMSDSSKMSPALRLDLDVAAQMVSVKMTLVSNFIGTPSMRSQAVRDRLLQIMSQDVINQSDLIGLQSLVDSEKAKISTFDKQNTKTNNKQLTTKPKS